MCVQEFAPMGGFNGTGLRDPAMVAPGGSQDGDEVGAIVCLQALRMNGRLPSRADRT